MNQTKLPICFTFSQQFEIVAFWSKVPIFWKESIFMGQLLLRKIEILIWKVSFVKEFALFFRPHATCLSIAIWTNMIYVYYLHLLMAVSSQKINCNLITSLGKKDSKVLLYNLFWFNSTFHVWEHSISPSHEPVRFVCFGMRKLFTVPQT